jgi:hypothetical protein
VERDISDNLGKILTEIDPNPFKKILNNYKKKLNGIQKDILSSSVIEVPNIKSANYQLSGLGDELRKLFGKLKVTSCLWKSLNP